MHWQTWVFSPTFGPVGWHTTAVVWKVSSDATEADEIEQASSLLFLKYLDSLPVNRMRAVAADFCLLVITPKKRSPLRLDRRKSYYQHWRCEKVFTDGGIS
jgi:hypothetical protein